jgi:acyl carrier protein
MRMDNVNTIKGFIVENFLFGDEGNLKNETDLFRESIVDSTGILELIAFIELTYNFRIDDNEIIQDNFSSINAITKFLQSKTIPQQNSICAE